MTQFQYTAVNIKGKIKKGNIEGSTQEEVRLHLKDDGLKAITIRKKSTITRDIPTPWDKQVKAKDMSKFLRQFSSIYDTGMPLISTLELLRKQSSNKNLKTALYQIMRGVEQGLSLSEALAKEEKIFSEMVCQMIGVGEQSATLGTVLDKLSTYYEKLEEAKNATIKAMIYPVLVIFVVSIVLSYMLSQVLPEFKAIFEAADTTLPYITQQVISCSDFLGNHFPFISLLLVACSFSVYFFSKTKKGRYTFDYLFMKLPIIKYFIINRECALFTNALSILLHAGIPLLEALEVSKESLKNVYFKDALKEVRDMVIQGSNCGQALKTVEIFPLTMCQMVSIGEESGQLSEMLDKTSKYYEQESKIATERLLESIEPTIMLLLCTFVGTIVFAMVLPMFSIYGTML